MRLPRHTAVVVAVLALHAAGLYALQSGLLRRAVEVVVPAEVIAQFIEPAVPQVQPPPPPQPKPKPQPRTQVSPPAPTPPLPRPPLPVAVVSSTPSPQTVTGTLAPQPPAPPIAAPVAASPSPPAPPAPPRIDLPSSNADYLNNRPPPYPPLSKRLGEQGKVVVRVFIGLDGVGSQAEIRTSSGYDRLDQAALKTVMTWQYLPGKVNGEPKAMWFNVPIHFVLEP